MTIADDARRKAGSQRWSPTGNASPWPIIAVKRSRLPSKWRLKRPDANLGRLLNYAATASPSATSAVEAGANPQSP